jgi:hypothetical protein
MCRILIWVFGVLYAGALLLFAAGTWGWLGAKKDPLSGVFLIPLGFPWTLGVDRFPENLWPVLMALAPAINLLILMAICWGFRSR